MTNTDIYSAITLGTTASSAASALKTSLGATTSAFFINLQATLGASIPGRSGAPRLAYVCSPFSVLVGDAPTTMRPQASYLDLVPSTDSKGITTVATELEINNGGYLYTWFEHGTLDTQITVTGTLVEID